jgi:ribose-phosphate pyrophosphokinase
VNEVSEVVGDLHGKTAIIVDDMISTGGTLVKAAEAVLERGATSVITCATHGIFADNAAQKLVDSQITEVVVTNTIPVPDEIRGGKIKVLSVASLLADAIRRIGQNRSISELYEEQEQMIGKHRPDHMDSTLFDATEAKPQEPAAAARG